MTKISEEEVRQACEVLETQFAGYAHDKVSCILGVLLVEEVKGLRCQVDALRSLLWSLQ